MPPQGSNAASASKLPRESLQNPVADVLSVRLK
jgi:hypothetical protein